MDCIDMGTIVDHWIKYLNAKDFDSLESLYAVDAVLYEAPIKRTKVGREHIRHWLETLTAGSDDLRAEINTICIAHSKAVLAVSYSGTNTSPFLGYPPTNRHFEFETCKILECEGGSIVKHTTYLDIATIFRSAGITNITRWYEQAA